MAVAVADRCRRCGTMMRNKRKICPCCGFDPSQPVVEEEAEAVEAESAPAASPQIRKVAAKAGVKICTICMSSVPEEQIIEEDGQKICPTCAENMKNKAMRKASGGPPK